MMDQKVPTNGSERFPSFLTGDDGGDLTDTQSAVQEWETNMRFMQLKQCDTTLPSPAVRLAGM